MEVYWSLTRGISLCKACPTLQRISTNALIIWLWRNEHVKHEIANYFLKEFNEYLNRNDPNIEYDYYDVVEFEERSRVEWKNIELEVQQQVENISLPKACKEELIYAIPMTGIQIKKWHSFLLKYTCSNREISKEYVNDIVWTVNGTVDKEATVDLLLKNHRDTLRANGSSFSSAGRNNLLQENFSPGSLPGCPDLFLFYLSRATEEQLLSVIENDAETLLKRLVFANRPWQEYFIPTIEYLMPFISNDDLLQILLEIVRLRLIDEFCSAKLFLVLWNKSPHDVKDIFLNKCLTKLLRLMCRKNCYFIKHVLKDKSDEEIYTMIISNNRIEACLELIIRDGGIMLDRFLVEIFESNDWGKRIKSDIANSGAKYFKYLVSEDKYEMFFNWCFSTDEEMAQFKNNFCRYTVLEENFRNCSAQTVKDVDKLGAWCLLSPVEIAQFKELIQRNDAARGPLSLGELCEVLSDGLGNLVKYDFDYEDLLL